MKKINKNLDKTLNVMHLNMKHLMERGYQIDELQMNSDALLLSSTEFMHQVVPWYKRITFCFCPSWWWRREASQEQPFDHEIIILE